jgi:uncharacterized peroxidase-related enzyme
MSWIDEIAPHEAEGVLKEMYGELTRKRGKVANILQVHSLRPSALHAHLGLYMDLMFARGGLSRRQRELIAVIVSRANACEYCVAHHLEALSRYITNADMLAAIAKGIHVPELPAVDRALLTYASKLTRQPRTVSEEDVQSLRAAGLTDEDILLANLIVAYFNFVNRIALGLGVEFTPEEVSGYDT